MHYAEKTSVSSDKSRNEIERTLIRYGASKFSYGWDSDGRAIIAFVAKGRMIRFDLPLPDQASEEFHSTPSGRRRRDATAAYVAWEQACRQRWRALALAIKAKLEAVECNIATFEEEFLAHIVLPNGETVGDWVIPQVEQSYATKKMPKLLLA